MRKIVAVSVQAGYRLRLTFDDGVVGEIDLSERVGQGVFEAWRDDGFFRQVRVGDFGELAWGDAIDLCPDALYLKVTGQAPEDLFPALHASQDAAHA